MFHARVAVQLPLPFPPNTSFRAYIRPMAWNTRRTHPVVDALRRLAAGDALVCGRWRVEYVTLARGVKQFRIYRSGRIVGLSPVANNNPDRIKRELAKLLPACGANWRLEYDAALCRRETRRPPARIRDVVNAWRWN